MTQAQQQKLLEKIVSVGAAEYAISTGIDLKDYYQIGVQVVSTISDPRPDFLKELPQGWTAVVGFRMSGTAYQKGDGPFAVEHSYAYGTALVKKSEADKPE